MSEIDVNINSDALFAMQDLLQDQFLPTLEFCLTEFDRLYQDLETDFGTNLTEAIRHAHSLKSNAAQFGADSLAQIARELEHALTESNMSLASDLKAGLPTHISATKDAINKLI